MAAAAPAARRRDYKELYQDLNQISERMRLDQMDFSEVMVIHRMYIKLEELDLGHLEGAHKVKRLYVLADVVEVEEGGNFADQGPLARLPGSILVVILCRVLLVGIVVNVRSGTLAHNAMRLQLPHIKLRAVEVRSSITDSNFTLEMHRAQSTGEIYDQYPALTINADLEQCRMRWVHQQPSITSVSLSPRFFAFMPDRGSQDVIFSSESRSMVDRPVQLFHIYSNVLHFIRSHPLPFPEEVTIDLASWEPKEFYYLHVSTAPTVTLNKPSETIQARELEPAFSLLKRSVPGVVLTDPNILLAMQASLLIAELVEIAHPSPDTADEVAKHVEWLNKLLIQAASETEGTSSHHEYLTLLFRAQYIMKKIGRARHLVVPQLQYDVYSGLINRMAQIAESYDQSLRQLILFIQQNKILGSYLLQQNRAFADKERDMDVFYSELISQREVELQSTLLKMDQLSLQMETQREDMEQAQKDMEAGLRRFQNRAVANAMFAVLGAVAAIGLAFLTGGATAPGAMAAAGNAVNIAGQAARALQRVLDILDGLQVVMEVVSLIKELVSSLQDLGQLVEAPEMPEMPLESDWFIFENSIEEVAEGMPEEVSEVSAWRTKCKNVAVLGREMISTAVYISQLMYDIKVQGMLQEIAKSHAQRLEAIQAADMQSYTEMVTQMDMRTTRMLVELIKVVYMQNAALMYQSLSPPTSVNAWPVTMETVWNILLQHDHAAVLGLMRLGPSFDFMRTYTVQDIPVSLLLDGEDWQFEIPVRDFLSFPSTWSRVRIHHLEMKFVKATHVHQPITDTGSIYLLLQGSRIFRDRNEDETIDYEAALPLDYHYAYRLDTEETTLSNLPSQEFTKTFMRMTPFSNWRLRLSSSAEENKGLAFPTATSADSTTQIAITFYVTAIRRISL